MENHTNETAELPETELDTEEQLTVEVPVEIRAGKNYGCCKRAA